MSVRTLTVALVANIGDFQAKMGAAGASASKTAAEIGGVLTSTEAKTQESLKKISQTGLVVGTAMLAGFGIATNAAMGFDKQMSAVQAATKASANELELLRKSALKAGADTVFSATEAATAQRELAKAGVETKDILAGGLAGALSLASAGGLELARAAEVGATALNVFELSGRDMAHVADLISAAAGESSAEVEDIAQAMNQSALVAKQLNLSLEDTSAVLGLFAFNGLKGSDAGTSFKTMLQRLTPQSDEAAAKMKELGIEFFDAQGNFVGISAAAEELKTGLAGLSEEQRATAMQVIFGSDSVRAASILYEGGAKSVDEWRSKVDQAGYASEVAATQLDNLAGDLEALRGSIDTALIEGGSKGTGALRGLTQAATDAVNGFSGLPGVVQGGALALLGIGGSLALVGGAVGTVVPKIAEGRRALESLGSAGQFANKGVGLLGKLGPLAGGIAVLAVAVNALVDASVRAEYGVASLEEMKLALVDLSRGEKLGGELTKQFGADLENLGPKLQLAAKRTEGLGEVFQKAFSPNGKLIQDASKDVEALDASLAGLVQAGHGDLAAGLFEQLSTAARAGGASTKEIAKAFDGYKAAVADADTTEKLNTETKRDATSSTGQLTASVEELEEQVEAAEKALDDFRDALEGVLGRSFDVQEATDGLNGSFEDFMESVRENGKSLDDWNDTGRRNRDMLRGLVGDIGDVIQAQAENGASNEELKSSLDGQIRKFEEVMKSLGFTKEETKAYTDVLRQIPTEVKSSLGVEGTDAALAEIERLRKGILSLPGGVFAVQGPTGPRVRVMATGGVVERQAAGGMVMSSPTVIAGEGRGSESYIPHHPMYRRTAVPVLHETASRLGFRAIPMASGGIVSPMPGHPVSGGGGTSIVYSPQISVEVRAEGVYEQSALQARLKKDMRMVSEEAFEQFDREMSRR